MARSVPRSSFGAWKPAPDRDPLRTIREDERGRIPSLVQRRRAVMQTNAFAFYRGCAPVMASDLNSVPVSGLHAQLGGDAHAMNFGGYGTPERRLVFDVNDFDETLEGPWEWDVARLCASLPLLADVCGFHSTSVDKALSEAVGAYRESMRELARRSPLEIWYSMVNVRGSLRRELAAPLSVTTVPADAETTSLTTAALKEYRESLLPHVRLLFDRYAMVEMYEHPVGVGSLGLYAAIVEFQAQPKQPLFLQIKQARASVLTPYLKKSPYKNHGERVVAGQRAMQATSDIFLGWMHAGGRDFYVRQFRDEKTVLNVENLSPKKFVDYARRCGSVLARAHARTGDPQAIAAYLGSADTFDRAMLRFARRYAKLVEHDYRAFCAANAADGEESAAVPRKSATAEGP